MQPQETLPCRILGFNKKYIIDWLSVHKFNSLRCAAFKLSPVLFEDQLLQSLIWQKNPSCEGKGQCAKQTCELHGLIQGEMSVVIPWSLKDFYTLVKHKKMKNKGKQDMYTFLLQRQRRQRQEQTRGYTWQPIILWREKECTTLQAKLSQLLKLF